MSDIKVFISSHKENVRIPKNSMLIPIQVGSELSDYRFPYMLHDDKGDNISAKNASYCELTAQYWVWKNVEADYYGFFHYRRYFSFSEKEFATTHEPFVFDEVVLDDNREDNLKKIDFDEQVMRRVIEENDFIVSRVSHSLTNETVYEQYVNAVGHHVEDLETVVSIIKENYPEFIEATEKYLNGTDIYCCNMFIMKKVLFEDYCNWLFDILSKHEERRDISVYPPIDRRVSGYLAERLCGIFITYLYEKGYKGKELQRVYFKNVETSKYPGCGGKRGYLKLKTGNPELDLRVICRGNGTVYSKIFVKNPIKEYHLVAISKSEEGENIFNIVSLFEKKMENDIWILEVPIVGDELLVTIKLCDKLGKVYGCLNTTINPKIAAVYSRKNKLVKRDAVYEILKRERSLESGLIRVDINTVITDIDGTFILQGIIEEVFLCKEYDKTEYSITLVNESKENILESPFLILRDKRKEVKKHPEYCIREVQFSFKIKKLPGNLIINVNRKKVKSFCAKENKILQMKVLDWKNRIATASNFADYHKWFLIKQRVSEEELKLQKKHNFDIKPVYSIIVPLYNTPINFLEDMIQSVQEQSYEKWELILVNASPNNVKVCSTIKKYAEKEKRIKIIKLTQNLGITENTNAGIEAAKGDFISFLDHDDIIEKDTLFEYTRVVNEKPDTDLLYCDEDKLSKGKYCDPYFKPDFNIDLLRGINYVCHFLTVRKSIVDDIDRPTKIYDGAQDHNMTLRVAERARSIAHVAKVLYHWRIHKQSTASNPEEKPYSLEAARLSIEHHLQRCNIKARVINSERVLRHYELEYQLPVEHPLISIIIPNRDSKDILRRCINSIITKSTYDNYEIVIVDNGSVEHGTLEYYNELKEVYTNIMIVSFPGEFNFPGEVNYGVKQCKGDYVLLLNNDTEVITENWLEKLLGPCMREDVGAVGAKLLFADGTVQHAGIVINSKGPMHMNYTLPRYAPGYYDTARLSMDVSAVTGACLMSKKSKYELVGGFDELFKIDYNDVDYCLKLQKENLLILYEASVELYHYESLSRDGERISLLEKERFFKERALLMYRWPQYFISGDPYYNKNFTKNSTYYSIS